MAPSNTGTAALVSVLGRAANNQALAELVFMVLFAVVVLPLLFLFEYSLIIIKGCANGRAELAVLRDAKMYMIKPFHSRENVFALWQKG